MNRRAFLRGAAVAIPAAALAPMVVREAKGPALAPPPEPNTMRSSMTESFGRLQYVSMWATSAPYATSRGEYTVVKVPR